jgi:hypothetical protein
MYLTAILVLYILTYRTKTHSCRFLLESPFATDQVWLATLTSGHAAYATGGSDNARVVWWWHWVGTGDEKFCDLSYPRMPMRPRMVLPSS